jgi:hypothetical protein
MGPMSVAAGTLCASPQGRARRIPKVARTGQPRSRVLPSAAPVADGWRISLVAGRVLACAPRTLVLVAHGCVAILPPGAGPRAAVDVVGAGEAYLTSASSCGGARVDAALWVEALTSSRIVLMDVAGAMANGAEQGRQAALALDLALRHAERAERRLVRSLRLPAEERVLAELRDLAGRFGTTCGRWRRIDVPLTQDLLADLTGGARETVNRSLRVLCGRGLVSRVGLIYSVAEVSGGTAAGPAGEAADCDRVRGRALDRARGGAAAELLVSTSANRSRS